MKQRFCVFRVKVIEMVGIRGKFRVKVRVRVSMRVRESPSSSHVQREEVGQSKGSLMVLVSVSVKHRIRSNPVFGPMWEQSLGQGLLQDQGKGFRDRAMMRVQLKAGTS